jgi:hypothetical protein
MRTSHGLRKFLQSGTRQPERASQAVETKAHHCLGMDIATHLSPKMGTITGLLPEETIMNSSMNHRPDHELIATSGIDRFVLLGLSLIALTAVLFYGAVVLLLWLELQ